MSIDEGVTEIAFDTKSPVPDLFRNYPQRSMMDLPPDMPEEYRQNLRSLLPYCSPNEVVADLAYASRDAAGRIVVGAAVQNRPWEWVENLGDPLAGEAKDEKQSDEHRTAAVKNTASLSLELFAARATGDAIVPAPAHDTALLDATLRSFHDNLSTESIFARDWRETRVGLQQADALAGGGLGLARGEEQDELGALPALHAHQDTPRRPAAGTSSRKPSPASSVRSRGSGRLSAASSRRPSPAVAAAAAAAHARASGSASTATVTELAEQDGAQALQQQAAGPAAASSASSGVRAAKRKASISVSLSDSDIEIIEPPPAAVAAAAAAAAAKKTRGAKAPARARAKKR